MKIEKKSTAGSLQSNDCLVSLSPGEGINLELSSPVIRQFGKQMEKVIREKLDEMNVTDCTISVEDKGALDCTIMARVETAVKRNV